MPNVFLVVVFCDAALRQEVRLPPAFRVFLFFNLFVSLISLV